MKKVLPILLAAGIAIALSACGGGEAQSDPALENEIIELETTANELDSTLSHIKEVDHELDAALDDLDLGE